MYGQLSSVQLARERQAELQRQAQRWSQARSCSAARRAHRRDSLARRLGRGAGPVTTGVFDERSVEVAG